MNRPIFEKLLGQGLLNELRKRKVLMLSLLHFTADSTSNVRSLHGDDLHCSMDSKVNQKLYSGTGTKKKENDKKERIVDQVT